MPRKDPIIEEIHAVREKIAREADEAAGLLIGFKSEDEQFEYRLESDPRFLARIEAARESIRAGRGVRLEEAPE